MLKPQLVVIGDENRYGELKLRLSGTDIEVAAGPAAIEAAANLNAEWVMAAIVGAAGLAPTLRAAPRGAIVALANKECLVCAGEIFMHEVDRCNATLFPVDSEQNASYRL